jgi:hypothetical protein
MRPDSVARVWSHYNLMNTSMTPSPIYQPIFDSLTNIPYPAYSTSSSSSEDLSIDIHVRQSLAGESPSTPDLLEDLFFTSLEFSRPQMTFTSFTPLVTAEDMINTCFSEWSSSSSGSDWSHTELASNEVFCVDYQSGNSVRIFSASSSSDEDLPPNAIEIDWSKVSSSSSSCSIDSSELFSCEDESFEEEIPQKFSVRRRQLPRRIPRSEKRKEREYKEKDRELPANDNIRSAWSRQLGSNDKLRPWTPYGPRIYQEFTLSRDQVKRLQMLYPYVCTGDFDVENMVQAFRAFCYLLYTQQWYRTNSSMDQKSDPHFWEKDICKKLYAVITGHRLQRLDGLMRPKVPLKDNALTYWIANYKFLLHCFSPVQEDAFTKRWELFYQNSQKYSATTSQI